MAEEIRRTRKESIIIISRNAFSVHIFESVIAATLSSHQRSYGLQLVAGHECRDSQVMKEQKIRDSGVFGPK